MQIYCARIWIRNKTWHQTTFIYVNMIATIANTDKTGTFGDKNAHSLQEWLYFCCVLTCNCIWRKWQTEKMADFFLFDFEWWVIDMCCRSGSVCWCHGGCFSSCPPNRLADEPSPPVSSGFPHSFFPTLQNPDISGIVTQRDISWSGLGF